MKVLVRSAAACFVALLAAPAGGQYLYLDANGDTEHSTREVVNAFEPNVADVWIRTDQNRNGSRAEALHHDSAPLTINSYELILHAVGGTVEWIEYVNLQPAMTVSFGTKKSETELRVAFGGRKSLPPGRHRLGRVKFMVTSGNPGIEVAPRSEFSPRHRTSFGSGNLGIDGDHTLKLDVMEHAANGVSQDGARKGDWTDVDGLYAGSGSGRAAAKVDTISATEAARFGVSVVRSGLSVPPVLRVTTTTGGRLRARVFGPSGRLVTTLIDEAYATPSVRELRIASGRPARSTLSSGVYFYRIEAEEGTMSGRFVVIK